MNYNRFGTFSTRPQSAKSGLKRTAGSARPSNNKQKAGAGDKGASPARLVQPEWNSSLQENPHKLSQAELLQRKLASKSNN